MSANAESSSKSTSICLLAFGLCAGVVIFFAVNRDYFTASLAAVVTIAAFSGYRLGAAKLVAFLASGGIGLVYASTWGAAIVTHFELTGQSSQAIATGGVGLTVVLVGIAVGHLVTRSVIRPFATLDALNCWSGLGVGALQGTVVVLLFIGGILAIAPTVRSRLESGSERHPAWRIRVAETVVSLAAATEESAFGPWLARNNPFVRFESLRDVIETAEQRS